MPRFASTSHPFDEENARAIKRSRLQVMDCVFVCRAGGYAFEGGKGLGGVNSFCYRHVPYDLGQ